MAHACRQLHCVPPAAERSRVPQIQVADRVDGHSKAVAKTSILFATAACQCPTPCALRSRPDKITVSDRGHKEVLHNFCAAPVRRLRKPLNANQIAEHYDLKEGFAIHCFAPLANPWKAIPASCIE